MKKNLIALAVATTVVGTASVAVQAAQYVSPNKTGEVIMFPFYNADNGNATNMHVVNTTAEVKAVKIRFVEYKNSDEVLDFNVYLSPQDHFAFGVIKNPNGEGGAVITSDNSCTVPALGSANGAFSGTATENADGSTTRIQPFVNYQYANSKDVDSSIERTLTGHVEVIEMGVVVDATGGSVKLGTALASSATHGPTGVPAACANLEAAWAKGVWKSGADIDASSTTDMTVPTGGLYGLAYHINVEDAASFGFEPTTIDDWAVAGAAGISHTNPGSLAPSLAQGNDSGLAHNGDGTYTTVTYTDSPQQTTSAVLSTTRLANDVMINPVLGGETDWVVTFPTKRFHVDLAGQKLTEVVAPFSSTLLGGAWIGSLKKGSTYVESPACEVVTIAQYDREEAVTAPTNGFSPAPATASLSICNEVAVIGMGTGASSAMSVETGFSNLSFPYSEGWQNITFAQKNAADDNGKVVSGLPAVGFAAYKVNNGAMSYGNTAEHKTANTVS